MSYLLMAIAGLWMADGLALLVAPLWIVGQVRQALSTSPSLAKWSGLTLVGGMISVRSVLPGIMGTSDLV